MGTGEKQTDLPIDDLKVVIVHPEGIPVILGLDKRLVVSFREPRRVLLLSGGHEGFDRIPERGDDEEGFVVNVAVA